MNKSTEINKTSKEVLLKELSTGAKTFAELMRLDGWKGDQRMDYSNDTKVTIWEGISSEAIRIIYDLKWKDIIEYVPSNRIDYARDGGVLDLPTFAIRDKNGEQQLIWPMAQHWWPCALALTEKNA